ncbi:MAG: SWIM zinc finger family protein [Bacteroidota bacterium]
MFTEAQIQQLAPKESAFKAGKKLGHAQKWESLARSERAIWGSIKGSGKKPYLTQIDTTNLAYKCTCPSRQFPCKHAIGLLLVLSQDQAAIAPTEEPEYVADWMDKRTQRAEKIDKEEKELTEEEKQKKSTAKAKRQHSKLELTLAGVAELKLWLKDLMRIGILELPNRPPGYFDALMKRMVDAKAPRLAGWIRALRDLPFKDQHLWQNGAIDIISKLFLLIKAAENLDQYPKADQQAIQGLLGWTFNQKEIAADENSRSVKDQWLVLGSEEEIQDDLTILRYWLYGLASGEDALIIRFQNKFTNSTQEIPLVDGSVTEAELVFHPGLVPHRAFIKKQKEVHLSLPHLPPSYPAWAPFQADFIQTVQQDPWTNLRAGIVDHIQLVKKDHALMLVDANNHYQPVSAALDEDKISTLLINATGEPVKLSFVRRNDGMMPLGLFTDKSYQVL